MSIEPYQPEEQGGGIQDTLSPSLAENILLIIKLNGNIVNFPIIQLGISWQKFFC